jgi:hypothetical protein
MARLIGKYEATYKNLIKNKAGKYKALQNSY